MRTYKEVTVTEVNKIWTGFTCDRCGLLVKTDPNEQGSTDWIELQERFSYGFTGGYGSVFGDMCTYEIDLCQRCLNETIGQYFRLIEEK